MGHSTAYSEVALCRFASGQPFANLVRDLMFPFPQPRDWRILHSLFLEFDRHGWLVASTGGRGRSQAICMPVSQPVSQSISQSASSLKKNSSGLYPMSQRRAEVCEGLFFFSGQKSRGVAGKVGKALSIWLLNGEAQHALWQADATRLLHAMRGVVANGVIIRRMLRICC